MEGGAGGSIVSDAAELTTRGMNSAEEEQELPSAIQDLVLRLEGQGEPITALPDLNDSELLEFFPWPESLSTIRGWRSQVRLRVLEAIGRCNTIEILIPTFFCERDLARLTDSEWEILLTGFRCSTTLRKIEMSHLRWRSDAEMESWCLQVGKILNTSSVTELQVRDCFLSARCWLNLASGLRGNPDSKLQWLELYDAWWKDTSAGKYVADMINRAPLIETLRLGGYYSNMEDETVGILSQALIQSSSLRELAVDQVKWGPALLKALAGNDGNRSIECLRLRSACMPHSDFVSWTRGLGDCLGKLLTCKPSWKEMELHFLEMSPEEWHQLGEVIRDNATATTILVAFNLVDGDQWKSNRSSCVFC